MVRAGTVRRLLRGVYAASAAPDTRRLRAAAVALAAGRDVVVVDRTAAWVHGVDVTRARPRPAGGRPGAAARRRARRQSSRQLAGHDVEHVEGLRLTTPAAHRAGPRPAAAARPGAGRRWTRCCATAGFTHAALLAELPRLAGHRGVGQLRTLAAQVDARSAGPAESVLRLHWHAARPAHARSRACRSRPGGRLVRLALGVERRQFGAVARRPGARPTTWSPSRARAGGSWCSARSGCCAADPDVWVRHLEREFHQHLLARLRRSPTRDARSRAGQVTFPVPSGRSPGGRTASFTRASSQDWSSWPLWGLRDAPARSVGSRHPGDPSSGPTRRSHDDRHC